MRPHPAVALVILLACPALAACDDDGGTTGVAEITVSGVPATGSAGEELPEPVVVEVRDALGAAVAGLEVTAEILRGGGSVDPGPHTSDGDGRVSVSWTLGVAPIDNELTFHAVDATNTSVVVTATLEEPLPTEVFGDVEAFLTEEDTEGSTEDLAFVDGRLLMGAPGGLLEVATDGTTSRLELTGDAIVEPLGLAPDGDGGVWIADAAGAALRHADADGLVTTHLEEADGAPLLMPNDLVVGPDGHVHLTDSCRGLLVRYDPEAEEVLETRFFEETEVGGPNGLALDPSGEALWLTTENIKLLCDESDAELLTPLAGLYRIPLESEGYGDPEPVEEGIALFGDGLAFDAEGNLLVIFDTAEGLALDESAIWIRPAGGGDLRKLATTSDKVYANLAFGVGAFGETTLYAALLAVPPFTEERGLHRLDYGVRGEPIAP